MLSALSMGGDGSGGQGIDAEVPPTPNNVLKFLNKSDKGKKKNVCSVLPFDMTHTPLGCASFRTRQRSCHRRYFDGV